MSVIGQARRGVGGSGDRDYATFRQSANFIIVAQPSGVLLGADAAISLYLDVFPIAAASAKIPRTSFVDAEQVLTKRELQQHIGDEHKPEFAKPHGSDEVMARAHTSHSRGILSGRMISQVSF